MKTEEISFEIMQVLNRIPKAKDGLDYIKIREEIQNIIDGEFLYRDILIRSMKEDAKSVCNMLQDTRPDQIRKVINFIKFYILEEKEDESK